MATYADDIAFVFSEVARLARMGKAVFKLPLQDHFATLPAPSGTVGHILCGAAAYRRLHALSELAISRSRYAGRIETQAVFEELKSIIVQRFMRDKITLDAKQADRVV